MKRTPIRSRALPPYTKAEEGINAASHIFGAAAAVAALVLCVVRAVNESDAWGIVSGAIYGSMMVLLYTVSGVYHALPRCTGKKVMQVLDHCSIYLMIGGTYTPILLTAVRTASPGWAWSLFGVVWGACAISTVFTAIDLKKYEKLSMLCYILIGWCIVLSGKNILKALTPRGIVWLAAGGVVYTIGAVLYRAGKKRRYMHCVFHIFVLLGSACHFVCIYEYVLC